MEASTTSDTSQPDSKGYLKPSVQNFVKTSGGSIPVTATHTNGGLNYTRLVTLNYPSYAMLASLSPGAPAGTATLSTGVTYQIVPQMEKSSVVHYDGRNRLKFDVKGAYLLTLNNVYTGFQTGITTFNGADLFVYKNQQPSGSATPTLVAWASSVALTSPTAEMYHGSTALGIIDMNVGEYLTFAFKARGLVKSYYSISSNSGILATLKFLRSDFVGLTIPMAMSPEVY